MAQRASDRVRCRSAARLCGIAASFPSRNRCRPSPCARALPGAEYYGGSVPSRTVRWSTRPAHQPRRARGGGQDRDGSRVHCDSLDEGGARLGPCGITTATPQNFTVVSRPGAEAQPRSSQPGVSGRVRTAPGPYPPGLSRYTLERRKRRFLAYSFPSRSPGPHHLAVLARPGFVRAACHPPRRHPGQAALSSTPLLRQGRR